MDYEGASSKLDLMKFAQIYNEIKTMKKKGDLLGIEVVDEEIT